MVSGMVNTCPSVHPATGGFCDEEGRGKRGLWGDFGGRGWGKVLGGWGEKRGC